MHRLTERHPSESRSGSDVSLGAAPTVASDEQVPDDIAEIVLAIEAQEEAEEAEAAQAAGEPRPRAQRGIDFTAAAASVDGQ